MEGAAPSVPEEFVVQMEAEDPSYPMPEGSVDGIFEMVISGNSFMSFPSMSYTEPGIYTYTIEQIAGLNPLCAYDPSVYHLKVSVTNAQDGSGLTAMVALRSEDADEKLAEAMFTNRYGTSPVPRDSNFQTSAKVPHRESHSAYDHCLSHHLFTSVLFVIFIKSLS